MEGNKLFEFAERVAEKRKEASEKTKEWREQTAEDHRTEYDYYRTHGTKLTPGVVARDVQSRATRAASSAKGTASASRSALPSPPTSPSSSSSATSRKVEVAEQLLRDAEHGLTRGAAPARGAYSRGDLRYRRFEDGDAAAERRRDATAPVPATAENAAARAVAGAARPLDAARAAQRRAAGTAQNFAGKKAEQELDGMANFVRTEVLGVPAMEPAPQRETAKEEEGKEKKGKAESDGGEGERVLVLRSFRGKTDGEADVLEGDTVTVVGEDGANWAVVVTARGRRGRVPKRFLALRAARAAPAPVRETTYLQGRILELSEDGWGSEASGRSERSSPYSSSSSSPSPSPSTVRFKLTERTQISGAGRMQVYTLQVTWAGETWLVFRSFKQCYGFWQAARRRGIRFPSNMPNKTTGNTLSDGRMLEERDKKLRKFVKGMNEIVEAFLRTPEAKRVLTDFVRPSQIGDVPPKQLPF